MLAVYVLAVTTALLECSKAEILLNDCVGRPPEVFNAPVGWPQSVSCQVHVEQVRRRLVSWDFEFPSLCTISDEDGKVISNKTTAFSSYYKTTSEVDVNVYLPDITWNSTTNYTVVFKAKHYCFYHHVLFNITKFKQLSCEAAYQHALLGGSVTSRNSPRNQQTIYSCETFGRIPERIIFPKKKTPDENFSSDILKNCQKFQEQPYVTKTDGYNTLWKKQLNIASLQWEMAGLYTCVVSYRGMQMFLKHENISVCVEQDRSFTFVCPPVVIATIGENVTIDCDFTCGSEIDALPFIQQKLMTPDESQFACLHPQQAELLAEPRVSCKRFDGPKHEFCFSEPPNKQFTKFVQRSSYRIKLSKLKSSDFGKYTIIVGFTGDLPPTNQTIMIKEVTTAYVTPVAVGVVIATTFLFLICLIYFLKYDILWTWKNVFGAYERVEKEYGAYMSYFYSNEMKKEDIEYLKTLVNLLQSKLDEFNCKIFDNHKEQLSHLYEIDNISDMQERCHKTIIILSKPYIADCMSMHETIQAFQQLVEKKIKIIFILMPGVENYIKTLKDETAEMLRNALKLNHKINWNGKSPLALRFTHHLQYALPKLPKPDKNKNKEKEFGINVSLSL